MGNSFSRPKFPNPSCTCKACALRRIATQPEAWPQKLISTGDDASAEKPAESEHKIFHYFPLLPPELRIQIWHQALSIPNIVGVRYDHCYHAVPNSPASLPYAIAQVDHEARYEVDKRRFKLPRGFRDICSSPKRRAQDFATGTTQQEIVANLSVANLWLKNGKLYCRSCPLRGNGHDHLLLHLDFQELQRMLQALELVPRPFGSPPDRTLAIPWTCFRDLFDGTPQDDARFNALVQALVKSNLRRIILVVNKPATYCRMSDNVEFRPVCQYRNPTLVQQAWLNELELFIYRIFLKATGGQGVSSITEILGLLNGGEAAWEENSNRLFNIFEKLRIEKCHHIERLKEQHLKSDEFDQELKKHDLVGFESWKVPKFSFCEVVDMDAVAVKQASTNLPQKDDSRKGVVVAWNGC